MLSKSLIVIAALGCGAISAIFASPAKCEKEATAWAIKQSSYNLGDVDIILAKDAMRWHNQKLGLTLLLHAPDWKLNAFNEANKKYLVLNKEEALEMFQHQRRRDKSAVEAPIRVNKDLVIAGMPTVCYCYAHDMDGESSKFAVEVTNRLEHGAKLNAAQRKYVDHAMKHERREYWLSKDITVSPKVSALFMERIAATTYGDNLPLRLVQIGRDGARTTMVDTKQVKKVAVAADTFKMPSGYNKAENKVALLINDNDLGGFAGEEEPGSLSSKTLSGKHEEVHR